MRGIDKMSKDVLTLFGFYGGKAKMASFICEMLDYKNTDIYIEPYGGACRVLLNKSPHYQEIYNDFSYGLANFFETMSKKELAEEVITELRCITPNKEVFEKMRLYKIEHEQDITQFIKVQFKKIVWDLCKKYGNKELKYLHKAISKQEYKNIYKLIKNIEDLDIITQRCDLELYKPYSDMYIEYWNLVKDDYNKVYFKEYKNCDVKEEKVKFEYAHSKALEAIEEYTSDVLNSNISSIDTDRIKMAVATFVTYQLSRDGMGIYYSENKGNNKSYYNSVNRLPDIANRLENVYVTQVDALMLVEKYCNFENVMLYLDPSYLNEKSEDLGKGIYARSYTFEEHKMLAEMIYKAKAKIILSNYDVEPYKSYLSEDNGWRKINYETTTSVGSKKENKRIEVLWCNY